MRRTWNSRTTARRGTSSQSAPTVTADWTRATSGVLMTTAWWAAGGAAEWTGAWGEGWKGTGGLAGTTEAGAGSLIGGGSIARTGARASAGLATSVMPGSRSGRTDG